MVIVKHGTLLLIVYKVNLFVFMATEVYFNEEQCTVALIQCERCSKDNHSTATSALLLALHAV